MSTIKKWSYGTSGYPSALRLVTTKAPAPPLAPTQMLLRVHTSSLNPVDIQIMNLPLWRWLSFIPLSDYRPADPGIACDFAGTVIATGQNSGYAVGDEVMGFANSVPGIGGVSGGLSEVTTVDVAKAVVVRKPSSWSWEAAAAVPLVWLTARTCIDAVGPAVTAAAANHTPQTGRVAVLGASSGVGMHVVRLAVSRGWQVLGSCSGRNEEFVKNDLGAHQVVDYTKASVPEEVKRFAPDAIIDCVGGTDCLNICNRYVTIVGDKTGRSALGGSATYLWNPQMFLRWAVGRIGLGLWYDCVNLEPKKSMLEEALTQLQNDTIVIDSTWEFSRVKEAFERLNTGRARGKVIVKVAQ